MSIMSRTLSVHQEHEVLLKLEAAGLDEDLAQRIIVSKDNKLAQKMILSARDNGKVTPTQPAQQQLVALPANGVEFELTLDPATQGLALVSAFGYSGNWRFNGKPIVEPFTRWFKLVAVGDCRNLDEVIAKCAKLGRVPEGSWLDAFRKVYPQNDGQGPIGVADPSWVSPRRSVRFPVLDRDGSGWNPYFHWASDNRVADWRWLVEVQGPGKLEA